MRRMTAIDGDALGMCERRGFLLNPGMWAVVHQPQTRRKVACYDKTARYRFIVVAGALMEVNFMINYS